MSEFPEIPGYQIEKLVGQGGMADVYLGHQITLDRKVAIKILIPNLVRDPNFSKRFIKEARTSAKLTHPNIVIIHDVGQTDNSYYIVSEYLPGGTLKDRIKERGSISPDEAIDIMIKIAKALDYAHSEGFIHRDIKPENIMFRKDGTPVLVDFGIAKAVGSSTKLTKTGMSIGTPHYMSPEQARGKELDGRSDYYSLGIVFYEMLTGRVPYDAEDSIAVAVMHLQEPVPELPERLRKYQPIIDKMLAKEPSERVSSEDELMGLIKEGKNISSKEDKKIFSENKKDYKTSKGEIKKDKIKKDKIKSDIKIGNNRKILDLTLFLILVVLVAIFIDKTNNQGIYYSEKHKTVIIQGIEFVKVEGGEFLMGSNDREADDDEKPVHKVYVDTFYISKYEITFEQYDRFCEETGREKPDDEGWGRGNRPVINVSWNDAIAYCKWLSEKTGENITLPTEAEWEYAAKGGRYSRGYKYSGSNNPDEVAWYSDNSRYKTHPVGLKAPNELGIYDMSGNVWEWVQDWYDKNYYSKSPYRNPKGPSSGSSRVLRGDGWGGLQGGIRSSVRGRFNPSSRDYDVGFRPVMRSRVSQ